MKTYTNRKEIARCLVLTDEILMNKRLSPRDKFALIVQNSENPAAYTIARGLRRYNFTVDESLDWHDFNTAVESWRNAAWQKFINETLEPTEPKNIIDAALSLPVPALLLMVMNVLLFYIFLILALGQ